MSEAQLLLKSWHLDWHWLSTPSLYCIRILSAVYNLPQTVKQQFLHRFFSSSHGLVSVSSTACNILLICHKRFINVERRDKTRAKQANHKMWCQLWCQWSLLVCTALAPHSVISFFFCVKDLKVVGTSQPKNSALQLENKPKNRYNNVLPCEWNEQWPLQWRHSSLQISLLVSAIILNFLNLPVN